MDEGGFDPNSDDVPLVSGKLEAAHIIPFALSNTQVRRALCSTRSG